MASVQDRSVLMVSVSGCRGIVGGSLTPGVVARYVGQFGAEVRAGVRGRRARVVLGRDGRRGGGAIAEVARGALAMVGCDVIDLGIAMTPTVGLMVRSMGADAGLVLTASHNPGEWNGVKPITRLGGAPAPDEAAALVERFRAGEPEWVDAGEIGGACREEHAVARHVETVLGALDEVCPVHQIQDRRFRVVVDSVNASGAAFGGALLARLGCDVVQLNADGSGVFPHDPEPLAENLVELGMAVREHKADIGFAQDPDGDRLAIVDSDGRFIGEEYTLVLAAWSLLQSLGDRAKGATVAANLSTSRMIDDVCARFGASVVRTPVGEAHVVAGMRAHGSVLGGEGNGGVIWDQVVPIRDSLSAMGLVLGLSAQTGKGIAELVEMVPRYAIVKRKLGQPSGGIERFFSAMRSVFPGASEDVQDGLRLDFETPDGAAWIHARASNTEPIFRLIAEAPTEAGANAILDRAEASVQ